jgi:hypothetical protein
MQTTLFEQTPNGQNPEITRTLNIITFFEDVATGKRGKQVYDYLASHLGDEFEFNHQVWKLDVLATPSLRELAAKDTADADIVIVSVRGDREFAPEVKSWLDVWVGNRGTPLALVALFDPEFKDSETAQSLRRYLENISRSAQMDFFAEPEQQLGKGIMGLDTPPRFDFEDGFQETILTEDKQDDTFFPRWGIND